MQTTLGIDEAGRGPSLGPMTVAGVMLSKKQEQYLSGLGVIDSKKFPASAKGQKKRALLTEEIKKTAIYWNVVIFSPQTIDKRVRKNELNELEREAAISIIDEAPKPDQIILDGTLVFGPLRNLYQNIETPNKAESLSTAVAAASLLAKERRELFVKRIKNRYEPLFGPLKGGGYSNPSTKEFVRQFYGRFGTLPPEARRSWPHPNTLQEPLSLLGSQHNKK